MIALLVILVVLAALGILGAVVKGLLWLTAIAVVAFAAVLFYGWTKLSSKLG